MGEKGSFKTPAVWGTIFIGACTAISISAFIGAASGPTWTTYTVIVCSLVAFGVSLCGYLYTFVRLGKRYGSNLLSLSAQTTACFALIFGLSVALGMFVSAFHAEQTKLANAGVGLAMTLLLISASVFTYAVLKRYAEFGFFSIVTIIIIPLSIYTIWQPWPLAVLMALSLFLLRKII